MKTILLYNEYRKKSFLNEHFSKVLLPFFLLLSLLTANNISAKNLSYEKYFLFEEYDSIIAIASAKISNNVDESFDYYWLSIALQKKGEISAAINILEESEKKFNSKLLSKSLANLYFETGKYYLVKPKYLQLHNYTDTLSDWIYQLSDIYEFENKIDSAIFYLKEFYTKDSLNYRTLIKLAENYIRLNFSEWPQTNNLENF